MGDSDSISEAVYLYNSEFDLLIRHKENMISTIKYFDFIIAFLLSKVKILDILIIHEFLTLTY